MSEKNLFEGKECPKCGHNSSFEFRISGRVLMQADGTCNYVVKPGVELRDGVQMVKCGKCGHFYQWCAFYKGTEVKGANDE